MIVYRLKSYSSTLKKNWDEEDELEDYVDGLKNARSKGIGSALGTGIILGGNGYLLKRDARLRRNAEQFIKDAKKNGVSLDSEDFKKANKMLGSKINKSKAAIGKVIEKYPKTAASIVASASLISGIKKYKDKTGKLERDLNRKYRGRYDRYPKED